jgi:hypothetical protein
MPTESPIPDGFQQAVAKFSLRLTKEEFENFKFSTLKELHTVLDTIQTGQGKRRELMNLTRIQAFLEAMDQYGRVVEVFLNASSILCFVWGPMKFLLQASEYKHIIYYSLIYGSQRPQATGPNHLTLSLMLISSLQRTFLFWRSIRLFSRTVPTCQVFCP